MLSDRSPCGGGGRLGGHDGAARIRLCNHCSADAEPACGGGPRRPRRPQRLLPRLLMLLHRSRRSRSRCCRRWLQPHAVSALAAGVDAAGVGAPHPQQGIHDGSGAL